MQSHQPLPLLSEEALTRVDLKTSLNEAILDLKKDNWILLYNTHKKASEVNLLIPSEAKIKEGVFWIPFSDKKNMLFFDLPRGVKIKGENIKNFSHFNSLSSDDKANPDKCHPIIKKFLIKKYPALASHIDEKFDQLNKYFGQPTYSSLNAFISQPILKSFPNTKPADIDNLMITVEGEKQIIYENKTFHVDFESTAVNINLIYNAEITATISIPGHLKSRFTLMEEGFEFNSLIIEGEILKKIIFSQEVSLDEIKKEVEKEIFTQNRLALLSNEHQHEVMLAREKLLKALEKNDKVLANFATLSYPDFSAENSSRVTTGLNLLIHLSKNPGKKIHTAITEDIIKRMQKLLKSDPTLFNEYQLYRDIDNQMKKWKIQLTPTELLAKYTTFMRSRSTIPMISENKMEAKNFKK